MNCKPGDLAVIVSSQRGPKPIGSIVRILLRGPDWLGHATWLTTGARDGSDWHRDCVLRPIRDPGDDAQDESLSWLPVPSREEVSA